MSRLNINKNKGFTLVEVMIAMMVLVIMTLIFAASVPLAQKCAHMNSDYSQALSLCQHKLDQLKAAGYSRSSNYADLRNAPFIDASPTASPFKFTAEDEVASFLPQPDTFLYVTQEQTDVLLVKVTVSWQTRGVSNKRSSVSLSTRITNVE